METSNVSTAIPADVLVKQLGEVSFARTHCDMLELQRQLGTAPSGTLEQHRRETLFLFEPSPVVTLGSAATSSDILIEEDLLDARGVEIHEVDRGGEATYHGPGQLLAYPVLKLSPAERDLHRLLRSLETAVLSTERWRRILARF